MNAIKRQFVDFFNYMRLSRCGVNANASRQKISRNIILYILFFVVIAFVLSQTTSGVDFIFGAMIGGFLGASLRASIKPSAMSVAPFTPKQRMIFSFLSSVIIGLFYAFLILIVSIIMVLFMALVLFLITGENLLVFEASVTQEFYSAYGYAYEMLLAVFVYFALYAISNLTNNRARIISGVSLILTLETFSLIMANVCGNFEYSFYSFRIYCDVAENITTLSMPWIPILILSIASALAIAAAVAITIMRYKTDKV